MTTRDRDRLVGVHPRLVSLVSSLLDEMEVRGTPMFVVEGVRTTAQQQAEYAKGRTTVGVHPTAGHPLGATVTMKDGVTHRSEHQSHADGLGYAGDCAFSGAEPFSDLHPWEIYGTLAESVGLVWGGRWAHPHDSPHIELKESA